MKRGTWCPCGDKTTIRDVPRGVGSLMAQEIICTRCGKVLKRENYLPMMVKNEKPRQKES